MSEQTATPSAGAARSAAQAWSRALVRTSKIAAEPNRVLATLIDEMAEIRGAAPALLADRESFTYRELAARANQYARWALAQDVAKGDVVCLLMPNRPEYFAIWLGITRVGGVVALLNTNITGASLAHSINVVRPKHVIVAAELVDTMKSARPDLAGAPTLWIHGDGNNDGALPRIVPDIDRQSKEALSGSELRPVTIDDLALLIYTSGTTGLPKAANVSHARIMQWSLWFAGLMGTGPGDRMYDCLPMYHSVGGVQAIGATLAGGGSVVVRDRFSARQFWNDVVAWDCTLFQYIGELSRYLLHLPPQPQETAHRIRLCCGNGLRADIWERFKTRFQIPQILEFYASTEGNVSLFNVEEMPGAVGRVPSYLAHRFPAALVRFDVEGEEPVRDDRGFCIRCRPGEAGEAIGPVLADRSNIGGRFEGYSSLQASEKKILRNVFQPNDAWFRTGDLLRRDDKGYFYFVDRIGDTYRWKGENVSTTEVSEIVSRFPGVREAVVYGVPVQGADGKAGMVALVAESEFDLAELRRYLADQLASYAQPLFVRFRDEINTTTTFKFAKGALVRDGFDPSATADPIYLNEMEQGALVRVDAELYERVQNGSVRL